MCLYLPRRGLSARHERATFRPDHAIIVLFMPAALLVSDLLVTLEERLNVRRFSKVKTILLGAVITILILWGLWDTRSIINISTIIADKSDMEAIEWIDSHTSQKARFFINVTPWLSSTYRGVDGGWWITPLTGRWALLPAVIYTSGNRDYVLHINTLAEKTSKIQSCTPDFWELIREEDLTYIYVKKNSGSLQPAGLEGCPNLELVYEQDGIYIYRVVN